MKSPECLDGLVGSFYRRPRSVPAAVDKDAGEPPLCCSRAPWRRLGLVGAFRRTPHCSRGRAGARLWLGRHRPWQRLSERRWRLAVVVRWGARGGQGGSAMKERSGHTGCEWEWIRTSAGRRQWDAATRVHARAKRALWPRPEHARQVLDEMPARARELG